MAVRIIGIDPGLVHTGIVDLQFDTKAKEIHLATDVVSGLKLDLITEAVEEIRPSAPKPNEIFIEDYRIRSNFHGDSRMVHAVQELKRQVKGSTLLNNMGVVSLVKRPLMELLGVWRFSTVTNHQDLRSAARIAIFGMLKQPELNEIIADVVRDHLNGETWNVL